MEDEECLRRRWSTMTLAMFAYVCMHIILRFKIVRLTDYPVVLFCFSHVNRSFNSFLKRLGGCVRMY